MECRLADFSALDTRAQWPVQPLAQGVPVICTKGTPWEELETCKCGWWIDIGVEPLMDTLQYAICLDENICRQMGIRGKALVKERYDWSVICRTMLNTYQELENENRHHYHSEM